MNHDTLFQRFKQIVGEQYVITDPSKTESYRSGYRFGTGKAIAVVRPATLLEQWQILQACVEADVIVISQAANTGLTGGSLFCSSCHMNDVVPEYQASVHFSNRSGVKAICADCHVPHEFTDKWKRKIIASREVYAHFTGKVDTKEEFEKYRLEMAEREWARLKANDSQECRNCHNFEDMDFTQQKNVAQQMHALAQEQNKTCIDCHKGIAHNLPHMEKIQKTFIPEDMIKKDEK